MSREVHGEIHEGVVVATAGRRVTVRDAAGDRPCFLSGQRAVVGDRVRWVDASGEGGKLVSVEDRDNVLVRADERGREQVLAANLEGVLVVCAPLEPAFRAGLIDRYLVAAGASGLSGKVVLNKVDQGIPDPVRDELQLRIDAGVQVLHTSATDGTGIEELRGLIASSERPWTFVGHSGVGKTSLAGALLPGVDVGEIGQLSSYWGQGRHTTTSSRLFELPGGGAIVDSPGIRTFAPGRITAEDVRADFPGMGPMPCRYRDCLHREGEEGCVAEEHVASALLSSYRRLLAEIERLDDRRRP
jgi:ribosome biogenesis GTPase